MNHPSRTLTPGKDDYNKKKERKIKDQLENNATKREMERAGMCAVTRTRRKHCHSLLCE